MIYFCQKLLVSDGLLESCSIIRQQTRESHLFRRCLLLQSLAKK